MQGKPDPGLLVRKSTFLKVSNKKCSYLMEADANYSVLLLDFQKEMSTTAFHTLVWVKKKELGDWMTAEKLLSFQLTVEIN